MVLFAFFAPEAARSFFGAGRARFRSPSPLRSCFDFAGGPRLDAGGFFGTARFTAGAGRSLRSSRSRWRPSTRPLRRRRSPVGRHPPGTRQPGVRAGARRRRKRPPSSCRRAPPQRLPLRVGALESPKYASRPPLQHQRQPLRAAVCPLDLLGQGAGAAPSTLSAPSSAGSWTCWPGVSAVAAAASAASRRAAQIRARPRRRRPRSSCRRRSAPPPAAARSRGCSVRAGSWALTCTSRTSG